MATLQSAAAGRRPRRLLQQKDWAPYVFLAPTLFFFVVFFLLPVGFSLYLTFTRWNGLSAPDWVGFDNYTFLARDDTFYLTLKNTLIFSFGTVLLEIPLALLVAVTFKYSRLKPLWRSLYWLPMVTSIVAIAYLWQFVLDGRYGLFNRLLGVFGIIGPDWLSNPAYAMWAVIIVAVWTELGRNMLLFSAGLEGIDTEYTEAAQIDGAGGLRVFWDITLPLLRPTLLFVSVTSFIGSMGSFALILAMTNGGPTQSTNVTALYMYQMAFQDLRMGRASAAAFVLFVIIFVLTLIQLRLFRRGGVEAY